LHRLNKEIEGFIVRDRELPWVALSDSVASAVAKMKACASEGVVVLDRDTLVGVFTQRDFLNRVVGAQLVPNATPVKSVMTPDPEWLSVGDCISYAINKMAIGGFRNVPILEDGRVVALLNANDVIGVLFDLFAEASDRDSEELNAWTDVGGG
jgi:CBS domain-containing protein